MIIIIFCRKQQLQGSKRLYIYRECLEGKRYFCRQSIWLSVSNRFPLRFSHNLLGNMLVLSPKHNTMYLYLTFETITLFRRLSLCSMRVLRFNESSVGLVLGRRPNSYTGNLIKSRDMLLTKDASSLNRPIY